MRKRHNSLRYRLMIMLLCTLIPLVAVVLLNVLYAFRVIENKTAQQYRNELAYYLKQLDNDMNNTDHYLAKLSSNNDDVIFWQYGNNEDTKKLAAVSLHNTLASDAILYAPMEGIFLYDPKENVYISSTDSSEKLLRGFCIEENVGRRWEIQQYEGMLYLTHIFQNDSILYGAWSKPTTVLKDITFSDDGTLLWTDLSGNAYTDEEGLNFYKGFDQYYWVNHKLYYVVHAISENGEFTLAAMIPVISAIKGFQLIMYLDVLLIVISVCLFPIWYILLQRWITVPVQQLVTAMERLGEGDLTSRVAENQSGISEYHLLNKTFNDMGGEIQNLKIDIYERQLEKQQAQLEKLQMQTSPHFLMNSLNIIYRLAETKNTELIQEMSLCLVDYYRYITQSDRSLVTVSEELSHVCNYLHIQKMRFPERFSYHIQVDEGMENEKLPPMTIQIFVENVLKHALIPTESIHLEILAEDSILYPTEFYTVEIRDTGTGFDEQILKKLQAGERCSSEGHVGIWNVQQRLKILYQNKASITFKNTTNGGANVIITLPMEEVKDTNV